MKKIYAITSVRNEEDIIESFVRYSLDFFDGMIINENCSLDGTREILESLKSEGLSIEILEDNRSIFPQEKITNALLDYAIKEYKADWVFPLDGDEFLFDRGGRDARDLIVKLDSSDIHLFGWETYVLTGKEKDNPYIPARFEYKRKDKEIYYKTCLSKELYEKGARFGLAAHDVVVPDSLEIERKVHKDLAIAHFPVRSKEQLMTKIIVGILNKASIYSKESKTNYHQQRIFDEMINKGYLTEATLEKVSRTYAVEDLKRRIELVKEPLPLSIKGDIQMKYTKALGEDKILSITLETAEGIIEDLREQKLSLERQVHAFEGQVGALSGRKEMPPEGILKWKKKKLNNIWRRIFSEN